MIIAIDGPAASGKGTLARRLAEHYGLPHLDTGLLYRATAASLIHADRDLHDVAAAVAAARGLEPDGLRRTGAARPRNGRGGLDRRRDARGARDASRAATRFCRQPGGAVLDGRDIGAVICPDAEVKIFVTASAAARAQRRALELAALGERVDYAAVLADIMRRDKRDAERANAPMRAAPDAVTLDTTLLGVDAAFQAALDRVEAKRGKPETER